MARALIDEYSDSSDSGICSDSADSVVILVITITHLNCKFQSSAVPIFFLMKDDLKDY